jgi:hypothetical protein
LATFFTQLAKSIIGNKRKVKMAYTSIIFKNPNTGVMKEAPVGFSWTTLFFICIPAGNRGDRKWALIQFVLFWITFGISTWVFPFIYNRIYIKGLINSGFKAVSITSGDMNLASARLGLQIPTLETI